MGHWVGKGENKRCMTKAGKFTASSNCKGGKAKAPKKASSKRGKGGCSGSQIKVKSYKVGAYSVPGYCRKAPKRRK